MTLVDHLFVGQGLAVVALTALSTWIGSVAIRDCRRKTPRKLPQMVDNFRALALSALVLQTPIACLYLLLKWIGF